MHRPSSCWCVMDANTAWQQTQDQLCPRGLLGKLQERGHDQRSNESAANSDREQTASDVLQHALPGALAGPPRTEGDATASKATSRPAPSLWRSATGGQALAPCACDAYDCLRPCRKRTDEQATRERHDQADGGRRQAAAGGGRVRRDARSRRGEGEGRAGQGRGGVAGVGCARNSRATKWTGDSRCFCTSSMLSPRGGPW